MKLSKVQIELLQEIAKGKNCLDTCLEMSINCRECPMSSFNSNGEYDSCVEGGPVYHSILEFDELPNHEKTRLTSLAAAKFLAQHISLFEED